MKTDESVVGAIHDVVVSMMDRVMKRVLVDDPFIVEKHHAHKPLYAALVPDEIFKGSHFERRFVTPFGNVWEKLAVEVASKHHGHCEQGVTVEGTVGEERLRRIQETLNLLEHGTDGKKRQRPDWIHELNYIMSGRGNQVPVSVTCDILIRSSISEQTYSFELKGPLPNSDQTKVSKEKMFKLLAMENHPVDCVYYALPYNPYGKRDCYAWDFPARWFDMKHDPCVLIGDELWDMIGGEGTYDLFVKELNQLGAAYKERIYREFLGMEPPVGFDREALQ